MIIASKHIFGNSSSNDAQICPRLTLQPLDYEDVHFTVISHDDSTLDGAHLIAK